MAKRRGWNEGSIWEERGRYRAQISLNGKRLSFTGKTRAECAAWIREKLNQIDDGMTYSQSRVILRDYIVEWLAIARYTIRTKTYADYQRYMMKYIIPVLGSHKLRDLSSKHIDRFYQTLLREGRSRVVVRYVHAVLHCALEQAVKKGIIRHNPARGATPPKHEHKEMKILYEHQVMQFLIAARESPFEALYHLAVKTGLRQGELLGLKWSDLKWQDGIIHIRRQVQRIPRQGLVLSPPKTASGKRSLRIHTQVTTSIDRGTLLL